MCDTRKLADEICDYISAPFGIGLNEHVRESVALKIAEASKICRFNKRDYAVGSATAPCLIRCSRCGKQVSNDTGIEILVKAYVECPECAERSNGKEESVKPKVLKASDVAEKESWTKEKPSEEFIKAICNEGSCIVTCEFCGITVFGSLTPSMYESGELRELQKKAATDPKYIEWPDTDTVWFGRINGKVVIPDHSDECDKKIVSFEKWIVAHRYIIAKFLNGRGNSIVADAKIDAKMSRINTDKL